MTTEEYMTKEAVSLAKLRAMLAKTPNSQLPLDISPSTAKRIERLQRWEDRRVRSALAARGIDPNIYRQPKPKNLLDKATDSIADWMSKSDSQVARMARELGYKIWPNHRPPAVTIKIPNITADTSRTFPNVVKAKQPTKNPYRPAQLPPVSLDKQVATSPSASVHQHLGPRLKPQQATHNPYAQ